MASLSGICVVAAGAEAPARIVGAGIGLEHIRSGPGNLWLDVDGEDALEIARAVSAAVERATFAFVGQRTEGCYCVAEYDRGRSISAMTFLDGMWRTEPDGSIGARPWHADLHFAELDERMRCDSWTEQERTAAIDARDRKDLAALPRLPPATFEQLQSFMEPYFDAAGAHAAHTAAVMP